MLKDHLGNIRAAVKQDGSIIQVQDYYAFGMQLNANNQVTPSPDNTYKYNGKEWNGELSLNQYDYGARFYDPVIGRFNSIDPLSDKMRRHSPYNYAFDNPIRFTDPDGMAPTDWVMGSDNKPKWDASVTSADDKDLKGRTYIGRSAVYTAANGAEVELHDGGAWNYRNQIAWQVPDGNLDAAASPDGNGSAHSAFVQGLLNADPSDMSSASAFVGYAGLALSKNQALLRHTADGASGWANKAFALKAVRGFAIAGKSMGVIGAGLTAIEDVSKGTAGLGTSVKVGIGLLSTFTGPVGLTYGALDVGVGIYTGTTLTDRIAAGIVKMNQ